MSEVEYGDEIEARIGDVRTLALYDYLKLRLVRPPFAFPLPAAGSDISVTVPQGVIWEVLALSATFTASAVVATRAPALTLSDGTTVYARITPPQTVTAGQVIRETWYAGLGDHAAITTSAENAAFPMIPLPGGHIIASLTTNIDVGDTWTLGMLTVREWSIGQVYWMSELLGRELDYEVRTELSAIPSAPERTGQPIPVSPLAR